MGDGSNTIDATRRREGYTGEPEGAPAAGTPAASAGRTAFEDAPYKMYRWITGDTCDKAGRFHDYDACVGKEVSGAGHKAELFVQEAGDAADVDPKDVVQNGLGDCYLMATLAGLAATPEGRALIHDALRENKDSTGNVVSYSVRLFDTEHHLLEGATVVPKWIEVPADEYIQGHAALRSDGAHDELWPLVIEKAYAQLRGGYNEIAKGGYPADALKALTGKAATTMEAATVTAQQIKQALDAHKVVVLSTRPDLTPLHNSCDPKQLPADNKSCIVPNHAYVVTRMEDAGQGEVMLHLGNPWNDPKWQPPSFRLSDLAKSFAFVDVGSP